MTLKQRQKMFVDFLTEQGFEARITKQGDVEFLYEDKPLYIIQHKKDERYFQLFVPAFCSLEDIEDREKIYEAIFSINSTFKVAKLLVLENLVYASVELFCSPLENFKSVFKDSLEVLMAVVSEFVDFWVDEYMDDDELDDSDDDDEKEERDAD